MEGIFFKRPAVILFLILLLYPFALAHAQTAPTDNTGPSLMISPVLFDLELKPGDIVKQKVTVVNNSNSSVDIITEVADFTYDNTGEMKFIEENEENTAVSSVKKWLSYTEKEFSIPGNKTKDVIFDINVPQNAEPGAHYGVIFFRSKPQNAGAIGVSARVGSLVLVTLPGNATKTGTLSNFEVGMMKEGTKLSPQSFFDSGPVSFSFQILNTGNVHFKPEGNITVTDMWGNKAAELVPADNRSFPGVTRTYTQTANFTPWGTYEATLTLKDGDGNQLPVMKIGFWGFNYKLVIQWTILIVVILFILILGLKQYNKWIIAQAHKAAGHHKK